MSDAALKIEERDSKSTLSLEGEISYSPELKKLIFLTKGKYLVVVNMDEEQLQEVVNGEAVPATVEIRY
jgi:hypothetical protein